MMFLRMRTFISGPPLPPPLPGVQLVKHGVEEGECAAEYDEGDDLNFVSAWSCNPPGSVEIELQPLIRSYKLGCNSAHHKS